MNVRPTDSTKLAAATELFAATSTNHEMGPIPFERLLRGVTPTSQPPRLRSTDDVHSGRTLPSVDNRASRDPNRDSVDRSQGSSDSDADSTDTEQNNESDALVEGSRRGAAADDSPQDHAAESLVAAAAWQSSQQIVAPDPKSPEGIVLTSEVIGSSLSPSGEEASSTVLLIQGELANGIPPDDQSLAVPSDATGVATTFTSAALNTPASGDGESLASATTAHSGLGKDAQGLGVLSSAVIGEQNQVHEDASIAGQRRGIAGRARDLAPQQTDDEELTADPTQSGATRRRAPKEARDLLSRLPTAELAAHGGTTPGTDTSQPFGPQLPLEPQLSPGTEHPAELAIARTAPAEGSASRVADLATPTQPTSPLASTAFVSRLPGQVLMRGPNAGTSELGGVHVDSARFLQRVARAFQAARDQGGEISLRLSPPELGALRVEVSLQDQGLIARVQAETPEARTILLENLPALRDRLAEQGIKLDRFDVDLSHQQSSQDRGQQPNQSDARPSSFPPRTPRSTAPVDAIDAGVRMPPLAQMINDRRLNVIV